MPLPVGVTPTNNLISGTTSGSQTRTPGAGEIAIVIGAVSSGGSGITVSGAGGTWTEIANVSDGTRRVFIWEGTNITSGSSQTVVVSSSTSMTCRWAWVAATGISSATPRDQTGSKTTANSTRNSTDCVGAPVNTPGNVLCVCAAALSTTASTISAPSGFTRITGGSSVSLLNGWGTFSGGLTNNSVSVTHDSITSSAVAVFASWNGDTQGGGGYTITADPASITVSGQSVNLNAARAIQATAASVSVSGQSADLLFARTIQAGMAAFSIPGQSVDLLFSRAIQASPAAVAITGQSVDLLLSRVLTADPGTLALSGESASLLLARRIVATEATVTITGESADLIYAASGANVLTVSPGTVTISGQSANLIISRVIQADPGQVSGTGESVNLLFNRILAAGEASISVAGQTAGLFLARVLQADPGQVSISGQSADLLAFRVLVAIPAAISIQGETVTLTAAQLAPEANFILWTSVDFRVPVLSSEAFTIPRLKSEAFIG